MKKPSKFIVILLVIAMLFALAACSQQQQNALPDTGSTELGAEQSAEQAQNKGPLSRFYDKLSEWFDLIVEYLILFVEFIGIAILVYAIVSAVIGLFRRQTHVRLKLAEGIALSLEFKMGGELLRTVIVREWNELLILGAIILLRAALTFLIQWEIKLERRSGSLTDEQLHDIKTPLTQDLDDKKRKRIKKKDSTDDKA